MKLFESFRSAADKYGDTLAREMLTAGIPDKYILAACRFHQESNGKESDILAVQFRQWMSFVVPKDKTIDIKVEVTIVQFDFEKNIVDIDGKEVKIGKAYVKEYSSDYDITFVIYIEPSGMGDSMELVWPENGDPYLLQITPNEHGVAICKMKLSHKPVAATGEDALIQLLNSLGGF